MFNLAEVKRNDHSAFGTGGVDLYAAHRRQLLWKPHCGSVSDRGRA